jgi:hypothetical protein
VIKKKKLPVEDGGGVTLPSEANAVAAFMAAVGEVRGFEPDDDWLENTLEAPPMEQMGLVLTSPELALSPVDCTRPVTNSQKVGEISMKIMRKQCKKIQ